MNISAEKFIDWAESHFDSVIVHGNEVHLNSIFTDDKKHKLWCNVKGGKKGQPACFHCWKTGTKGTLISLVMLVDQCDFETAVETLGGGNILLRNLEQQLKEFFHNKYSPKAVEEEEEVSTTLAFPPYTRLITELPSYNFHRVQAEVYLFNRKLSINGLMIATGGTYRHRIIIPYYDREGKLIYFNCRHMGNKEPKYLGPPKELGVGKDDVLYVPVWPSADNKIYLTEGEFDAQSIYCSGQKTGQMLYAAAFGGKNLSEKQTEMIRPYQPVLCLDTDKAGKEGLAKMGMVLRANGMRPQFVRPPKIYKDWNAMLQKVGSEGLVYYLLKNEKPLSEEALLRLLS
jgi:hypothetical protein